MYTLIIMNYKHSSWNRPVLDSLVGQFWTVKDGLNLVFDTVRPKPSFGRPKPNPVWLGQFSHLTWITLSLKPDFGWVNTGVSDETDELNDRHHHHGVYSINYKWNSQYSYSLAEWWVPCWLAPVIAGTQPFDANLWLQIGLISTKTRQEFQIPTPTS